MSANIRESLNNDFLNTKPQWAQIQKNVVGQHFNGPGHSIFNMEVAAIEKVKGKQTIEKRESMWIEYLAAEFKGLNQKQREKINFFIILFLFLSSTELWTLVCICASMYMNDWSKVN